jgi:hypothetical protein
VLLAQASARNLRATLGQQLEHHIHLSAHATVT